MDGKIPWRMDRLPTPIFFGFSGGSDSKESIQCRIPGFDPWIGKIPWRRDGYSLQYSGLENSMDRGAWQATVHRVAKSQTQLSNFHFRRIPLEPRPKQGTKPDKVLAKN